MGLRSSVSGTKDGSQIHFFLYDTCQYHILSDSGFCFPQGGLTLISEEIILHAAPFPSQSGEGRGEGETAAAAVAAVPTAARIHGLVSVHPHSPCDFAPNSLHLHLLVESLGIDVPLGPALANG